MLTNTFSFENGYLIQLDDILAKRPTPVPPGPSPVPPAPPGPAPTVDPIEQVGITLSFGYVDIVLDATGDLSTLDHYEFNVYSGTKLVKTINNGTSTTLNLPTLDKTIAVGTYTIDCSAISTLGNSSEPSAALEYTVLSEPAAMTLRFEFSKSDYDPTVTGIGTGGTWSKQESAGKNIWDWTNANTGWTDVFTDAFLATDNEVKVIATGDITGVTNMSFMFNGTKYGHPTEKGLNNLVYICNLNTPNCSTYYGMLMGTAIRENPDIIMGDKSSFTKAFEECHKMTKINLFTDPHIRSCDDLFFHNYNVETNVYEMYLQLLALDPEPAYHSHVFTDCGINVEGGLEILNKISSKWGGRNYNN